jgi:hypothetical protein
VKRSSFSISRRVPFWILIILARCGEIWEQDYAHRASKKKRKRDAYEVWLYREKEDKAASNEFSRYSIKGPAIPATD